MEEYKNYVRQNARRVKQTEEIARFASMLIPKGPLGEVGTEGSFAILGLIGVVNDAIIHGKTKRAGEAWSFAGGDKKYQIRVTIARSILTFFAHFEPFLEVTAAKFSTTEVKERLIVAIEIIKAAARLLLLKWFPRECVYAGGRFESYTPAPNETTAANPPIESVGSSSAAVRPAQSWVGRRSGLSLKVPQSIQKYLDASNSSEPRSKEVRIRVIAELIHIARPVFFVLIARRFRDKWWPFLLSFAMDLVSLRLFQSAAKISMSSLLSIAGKENHDITEFRRRTWLLLFYLFRSPLYEKGLGAFANSLVESAKSAPAGLGNLAELIAFQLDYYHNVHFYSAAS